MRTFTCTCGNRVFFENDQCVACQRALSWCPTCESITAVEVIEGASCQCVNCESLLSKCWNNFHEGVCNRSVLAGTGDSSSGHLLCDYCRFNDTIPDLSVEGNHELWFRLEKAKRRLLYTLDLLDLPYGRAEDGFTTALSFDFKGDIEQQKKWWWQMGKEERVYTGHANGKITINIQEADEIHRVKARVSFNEAHRTEIGHFRHEMGHYFWELLVPGRCEDAFKQMFGDHENPGYQEALARHYETGPEENWEARFISAYATMHPWEDFAETFATYLDMVSILDTAKHVGISGDTDTRNDPRTAGFEDMVKQFIEIGVVANEMNRAQGLIDLVPEVFSPPVLEKLEFVHSLLRGARKSGAAMQ